MKRGTRLIAALGAVAACTAAITARHIGQSMKTSFAGSAKVDFGAVPV
jgi:hypothetical protein